MAAPLSIPDLVAGVREQFATRSISASVVFGDWNVQRHNAADHVIFGLADFTGAPPGPHYAPGALPLGDGTAARALYARLREHQIFARRYFYPLISDFPMYRAMPSADFCVP